jgi:RNA polymerase sigma factor (TIGR02999 family)
MNGLLGSLPDLADDHVDQGVLGNIMGLSAEHPWPEGITMTDVTRILSAIEDGHAQAAEQLLPLVYDELRKLAAQKMAQEKPGQTLQATALVHEAYVRLVDVNKARHWNSRGHFFGAAAEAMRRILVEQARRKAGPEAGGGPQRVELSHVDPAIPGPTLDLLALNDALDKLAAEYPRVAKLVKLRFFAGLTREQAAAALGVSTTTADDDWAYAKGRLRAELSGSTGAESQA